MITNTITVDFLPKVNKLAMAGAFHLMEVFRSFPSRRFDPKSKRWLVPIVKQNLAHFLTLQGKYDFRLTQEAKQAISDADRLMAGPVYEPIPKSYFAKAFHPPMDHQWEMMNKGYGLKAYALFAAMGTGKTFVTIHLAMVRYYEQSIDRVMVICPSTLFGTWRREFNKYFPGSCDIRDCVSSDKGLPAWCAEPDEGQLKVLLVGVEGLGISKNMPVLATNFVSRDTFCVCDESSRIKNADKIRTKAAIRIGNLCKYRMVLNGTPIAKGLQDLWSQYEFLDPNIIGSGDYWAFKTRYVVMGGYENKSVIGFQNVEELMNMITPYTLEVNKKILNLPPKIYKQIDIEPTKEQKRLFEKIVHGHGEGAFIKAENVLERMLRMQQVIGGFEPQTDIITGVTTTIPLAENPKMDALLEVIDANRVDSKFIIWARFVPEIHRIIGELKQRYGEHSVVAYYGDTNADERTAAEDRYCRDPGCRFFVGNPAAAGLGLTLISGENDVMVYYSGTFAYIDRMQSEDRNHRIGQRNTVVVVDLVVKRSLDVAIQKAIAAKMDMDKFVKDWIAAGLPFDQLLETQ